MVGWGGFTRLLVVGDYFGEPAPTRFMFVQGDMILVHLNLWLGGRVYEIISFWRLFRRTRPYKIDVC